MHHGRSSTLTDLGNPFDEVGNELVSLGSKDIADQSVHKTVAEIKNIGQEMCKAFIEERIQTNIKSITAVIHRNKLPLFKDRPVRIKDKKIIAIKNDTRLFSRLFISCQTRSGNMETFFSHENQQYPPSLSDANGCLRHGVKSEILPYLEAEVSVTVTKPGISAVVLDGAAIVQMLGPRSAKSFSEYSRDIFNPYLLGFLESSKRVDVIWDEYRKQSLKQQTRDLRRKGIRRRVSSDVAIPSNWHSFLRVDKNKTELFAFLSCNAVTMTEHNIIATKGQDVLCSQAQTCTALMSCLHEEADTRIMVHCKDAVTKGHLSILIRTVDSDVVTIAVSSFELIKAEELWIGFGTGKKFRYIPVHEIVTSLGPQKARCLGVFHAFTGCDTVSSFDGRGKKSAWDRWTSFPAVSEAFSSLANFPTEISTETMELLERFVVLLYDRTSHSQKVIMQSREAVRSCIRK